MEDHDQRFKTLLKRFIREFFELFFPDRAGRFDWSRVEWLEQETFVDPPRGKRSAIDLIAKIPVRRSIQTTERDPESYVILIHIEIDASESVAALRPRVFTYYTSLRGKHQLPVLLIGLYLQVGMDGAGWDTYGESLWGEALVQFRYPYIGLPGLNAEEYLTGDNLLGVALSVLMRMPEERKAQIKADALQRLATSPLDAVSRYFLCECVEAYLPLDVPHLSEFERLLLTSEYQEAHMVAQTSYEKGIEKGIDAGIDRGQALLLVRQIQKRFGPLAESARQRIESMSRSEHEQLAEAILTASTLEELGLETPSKD